MKPWLDDGDLQIYVGDCREVMKGLPDESVHCVVTSPPYWGLRNYLPEDHDGKVSELGLERTPGEYVENMVGVFREVRRVLRTDGTCWLNLGPSYMGDHAQNRLGKERGLHKKIAGADSAREGRGPVGHYKGKDLVGIPWMVALALQQDGWWLRSEIIWDKNCMPESVRDRVTRSHEQLFLLTKNSSYFYDQQAIMEPAEWARWGDQTNHKHEGSESAASWIKPQTKKQLQERGRGLNPDRGDNGRGGFYDESGWRNARSVWYIPTESYTGAHFALFPKELPRRCIKAGCPAGGVVLDPFGGAGTTGVVARELGRKSIMIELSEEFATMSAARSQQLSLLG